ncbi:MAG: hypothetical protein MI739_09610, partial [Bacteroidales bacterium]|nr:hypothetical protein [Bacteroidales bacterium]
MKKLLILSLHIFFIIEMFAQTTIDRGNIAFVGVNTDDDQDFSFILFQDIDSGTIIYFTDKGWTDGTGFVNTTSNDGTTTWTASSDLSKGTIINIVNFPWGSPTTNIGIVSGNVIPSAFGDQLFAYQGTEASPYVITGVHFNSKTGTDVNNWDGSTTSFETSALPDVLTPGTNAVWLYIEYNGLDLERDNFRYDCSVTSGSVEQLRAAINNLDNWEVDMTDFTAYTLNPFPCSFSVCTYPEITSISESSTAVCEGDSVTLTITGNLNDATAWHVYADSCGGTFIDSTTTSILKFVPTKTTAYYIRGEGGCVIASSCDSSSIISFFTPDSTTEAIAVCYGDSYTFPDGTIQNNIITTTSHISNLNSVFGCDSVVTTTVNVNPVYSDTVRASICSGSSYTFPDGTTQNNITADVIENDTLTTALGCDSIIRTELTILPVFNITVNANICSGDSYTFPDGNTQNNITANVTEIDTLTSTNSCDSIITTNVIANPHYDLSETVTV